MLIIASKGKLAGRALLDIFQCLIHASNQLLAFAFSKWLIKHRYCICMFQRPSCHSTNLQQNIAGFLLPSFLCAVGDSLATHGCAFLSIKSEQKYR